MTDAQLYLVTGIPTLAVLTGMLFNVLLFAISLERRFDALQQNVGERFRRLEARSLR